MEKSTNNTLSNTVKANTAKKPNIKKNKEAS